MLSPLDTSATSRTPRAARVPGRRGLPTRWWGIALALLALVVGSAACSYETDGPIPAQQPTPTPCAANCVPPTRGVPQGATVVTKDHFSLVYFDPWTVQDQDSGSVLLGAQTQFGTVSVLLADQSVTSGTTSAQLLQSVIQQYLNTDQFSGLQDAGAINGAEIGYISGAGESYGGYATQPGSPSVPVYINVMAATHGSVGLYFIAVSPLDPNSPDPSITPAGEFDHLVNSVQWLA